MSARALLLVAGVLAFVALVAGGTVAVYEGLQRSQCERLGHVFSPVRPDGRLSQCWVQP